MKKEIIQGIIASIFLALIYFLIVSLAQGFEHAINQFLSLWYLMIPLMVGFGIQVAMFFYIRRKAKTSNKTIMATGGISTGSMIACCAHHITDVLPIIGLSGIALFISDYQIPFILLGVFSNLVGIIFMLEIIKNQDFSTNNLLQGLFAYDLRKVRNATLAISIVILSIAFLNPISSPIASNETFSYEVPYMFNDYSSSLPAKFNNENGLSIQVTPIDFNSNEPLKFDVSLNTHQGDLSYDLTKVSFLEDNKGNVYEPINWKGSPLGGHHRYGILTFPKINNQATSFKLVIKNVYDSPVREFEWKI